MSEHSQKRLESRIVEAVNTMLVQREIKNPRLSSFVSITRATLSKDNAYATLYVSSLDQANDHLDRYVEALERSAGFIQGRLALILKTRNTPRLNFKPDPSIAEGQRLNELIDKLNSVKE
ncbi:MAG: 30S ribosome-binding factor RbfA [Sphaerochaetaceae bacterium]|jgi:ribosome-binding factor A|nr:30S ribosome-binding factor RbfA [Sphaerochaetaceae bacterium]NLY06602.1 30S ribosome-binding factor RbfA [Spirochaetales bacterium]